MAGTANYDGRPSDRTGAGVHRMTGRTPAFVTLRWKCAAAPVDNHHPVSDQGGPPMSASAPAPVPSIRGRFVWYELMTTDVPAAMDFYTKALGWGTQKFDGPIDYHLWTNAGAPVGGVMALPEEARAARTPPHWLAAIGSADVDATVTRASQLGGRVLAEAMDIPNIGRYAVLADPQGAAFSIYTPAMDTPRSRPTRRRGVVARARDDGSGSGLPVLRGSLRVGEDDRDGHGGHRHLPDVRPRRTGIRWHLQQASRDARAAQLAALRPRRRTSRRRSPGSPGSAGRS